MLDLMIYKVYKNSQVPKQAPPLPFPNLFLLQKTILRLFFASNRIDITSPLHIGSAGWFGKLLHTYCLPLQGMLKQLLVLPGADASQLACPTTMPGLPSISRQPDVQMMEAGKFNTLTVELDSVLV